MQTYLSYHVGEDEGAKWIPLADENNSEPYEVDVAEIWQDTETGEFLLLTASGCSCWGGEYSTERFPTLEAIAATTLNDRQWAISPGQYDALIAQARVTLQN